MTSLSPTQACPVPGFTPKCPSGVDPTSLIGREDIPQTVEHIFTHVRHTMHVERACVPSAAVPWVHAGRSWCWMGPAQMASVGVTAGVKKVIAAVCDQSRPIPKGAAFTKRKRATNDGSQPTLSSFFGKS